MLSAAQATRLNKSNPEFQRAQPFDIIASTEKDGHVTIRYAITTDISARGANLNVPFAMEITDITVQARVTRNGGLVYVRGANLTDLFASMPCAVDKAMQRAPTLDDIGTTLAAGETIVIDVDDGGERGLITIYARRI